MRKLWITSMMGWILSIMACPVFASDFPTMNSYDYQIEIPPFVDDSADVLIHSRFSIPEPATLALCGIGLLIFRPKKR
ncbi:MAG: hypothetical protein ABFD91_17115 [Anaerohalosphaeraceae bacterium]